MSLKVTLPCKHVSHTAWLVAAFRAQESARSDAHFRDHLAPKLLGHLEEEYLSGFSNQLRKDPWLLTIRTYYIDQFILQSIKEGVKTIVNLGAGLDTRPYRLAVSPATNWIEADYAELVNYKNSILAEDEPCCKLKRLAVDLSITSERIKILDKINKNEGPILILTEGLLPYLKEDNVKQLARELFSMSETNFWLMDIFNKSLIEQMHDEITQKQHENNNNSVNFDFTPENTAQFLKPLGWEIKAFTSWYEGASKLNRYPEMNKETLKSNPGFLESGIGLFKKTAVK
jgi:methyltransferase (TIGR00027 family)